MVNFSLSFFHCRHVVCRVCLLCGWAVESLTCVLTIVTNQEKMKDTNMERYGAENPFQNEDVKQKIRDTNMKTYGVPYAMQNAEFAEEHGKRSFQWKEYKFPCGTTEVLLNIKGMRTLPMTIW